MLDERYLIRGIDALCRAHETDYFVDGHKGAAIISAWFLCCENEVEEGVPEIVADMLDEHWVHTPLCVPFPDEQADEGLLNSVATALDENIGPLRQAGHNVIFPALALKAFAQGPETVTPSRVAGICRLIERFDTADNIALEEGDDLPPLDDPNTMADAVLSEMVRAARAFVGRGQGWTGHLLTVSQALVDLAALGYGDIAQKGLHTLRLFVKRARLGPRETDKVRPEHPRSDLRPLERAYWVERRTRPVGIGHCFKYPYGFYGLLGLARDGAVRQRALAESFRIF